MSIVSGLVVEGVKRIVDNEDKEIDDGTESQVPLDIDQELAAGESVVVNFRSKKHPELQRAYPFASIDTYNGDSEKFTCYINQVDHLSLETPAGGSFGDTFDVGITSVKIKNTGNNPLDLSKCTITVSGDPSGVRRGNV